MDKIKKYLNPIGFCLTVAALFFLVRRIIALDINISDFADKKILAAMVIGIIGQAISIIFGCIPWSSFVQALTGKKIRFKDASPVYIRSNVYKYIPGNVFQFVGRNKLAVDMNISHADVAASTVFDIALSVVVYFIFSVFLLRERIVKVVSLLNSKLLILLAAAAVICIAVLLVLLVKFKEKIMPIAKHYLSIFSRQNIRYFFRGAIYYVSLILILMISYMLEFQLIFKTDISSAEMLSLSGAYLLSWLVGFVTPGAPGGIGIRESVMILLAGEIYRSDVVLFVLVLRISNIIADILSFAIASVYDFFRKRSSAADR